MKIYLCSASADEERAGQIVHFLRARGDRVTWGISNAGAGRNIEQYLEDCVAEADLLLVIVSRALHTDELFRGMLSIAVPYRTGTRPGPLLVVRLDANEIGSYLENQPIASIAG